MDPGRELDTVNTEYRARIARYITGLIGDAVQAEDLTQEVLARVHRGLPDLRNPDARTAWVFRIASNVAFDHLRTRTSRLAGRMVPVDGDPAGDEASGVDLPSEEQSAEERLEQSEMAACLREHIHRLSPPLRACLILRDLEGLSERAVADILGCSLAAVKVRTHRARRALRALLQAGCEFYADPRGVFRCERAEAPAPDGTEKRQEG